MMEILEDTQAETRASLNKDGFAIIRFPNKYRIEMMRYIQFFLSQAAKISPTTNLSTLTESMLKLSEQDYIEGVAKTCRMFPNDISKLIMSWVQTEIRNYLGVGHTDSNYVSLAERRLNPLLTETTYDIFWRCVRPSKNDVGPAHCDYQFWELLKNTDADPAIPFVYRNRWKIWIPLMGCEKNNMLQIIPSSHIEDIPMQVIDTPFGKRPWLEPAWYEKNKSRFISPLEIDGDYCILFHDKLIHRGSPNYAQNLRISAELTVLCS